MEKFFRILGKPFKGQPSGQYFGHLMQRTDSLKKTLVMGKIEGSRGRGWQRMRWLDGILTWLTWVWASSGEVGDRQGSLVYCSPWGHKELDVTEWLNWTDWRYFCEDITYLNWKWEAKSPNWSSWLSPPKLLWSLLCLVKNSMSSRLWKVLHNQTTQTQN